jgi:hypothetical protein
MSKFQKHYPRPPVSEETTAATAATQTAVAERAIIQPAEADLPLVVEVPEGPASVQRDVVPRECGIAGCRTWYEDPLVMKRHRFREHGIGENPSGGKDYPGPKPLSQMRRLA